MVSMEQGCFGRAEISLEDRGGNCLLHYGMDLPSGEREEICGRMPKKTLGKVIPWENKNPVLYSLLIRLYDEGDELVEVVPYSIGFRTIEIRDKVIFLNGKRLVINGVNRHEWSAEKGRCIGMEEMRKDMDCLISNHIRFGKSRKIEKNPGLPKKTRCFFCVLLPQAHFFFLSNRESGRIPKE